MAKGKKGKKDQAGAAAAAASTGGKAASGQAAAAQAAPKTGVAKADARVTPEKSRTGPIENFYTVGSLLSPECVLLLRRLAPKS